MRPFQVITLALLSWTWMVGPSSAQNTRLVEFSFTPTKRAQIALWVEDELGNFLSTVTLTEAVALRGIGNRPGATQMNSGFRWPYGRREGVLPVWAHRRASAPDADLFKRVIFQDRRYEGLASRTSADYSRDDYFCLSFDKTTTTKEALDAVTCASQFFSDKGRFIDQADINEGYGEPFALSPSEEVFRPLSLGSLYPPRRDVFEFQGNDHPDAMLLRNEALAVMPELDAITMATPAADIPLSLAFTVPEEWEDGAYVAWIEVHTEGDHNSTFSEAAYPTPNSDNWDPALPPCLPEVAECAWDNWAETNGYPYRGQPSVVYKVPFEIGVAGDTQSTATAFGYGALHGEDGNIRPLDANINDDPIATPGSGADRLRKDMVGQRFRVEVAPTDVCSQETAPEWCSLTCENDEDCGSEALCDPGGNCVALCEMIMQPDPVEDLELVKHENRKLAHRVARLRFIVPDSRRALSGYAIRTSVDPGMSSAEPAKAPAQNDAGKIIALPDTQLRIPTNSDCESIDANAALCEPYFADETGQCPYGIDNDTDGDCLDAGDFIDAEIAFAVHETTYFVTVSALDACQEEGVIQLASVRTSSIDFETVSPCFVATATYGSPLADEVWVLRNFRDQYLMKHSLGRHLVRVYYSLGPHAADVIRKNAWLRTLSRRMLAPLIEIIRPLVK